MPEVKTEGISVDLGIAGTILKWILMEMVPIIILKKMPVQQTSGLLYREENWPRGPRP
jgi:hypothetical protein